MLKSIRLQNWKSFAAQEIELKPLTLLSGQNGSGKSSLLQALLVLRQSYQQKSIPSLGLALQGELAQLGTVEDVRYEFAEEDEGEIALSLDHTEIAWKFIFSTSKNDLESRYLKLRSFPSDSELARVALFEEASCQTLQAERIGPRVSYGFSDDIVTNQKNVGTQGEFAAHFLSKFGDDKVESTALHHPQEERRELKYQVEGWMGEVCPGTRLHFELHPALDQIQARYSFQTKGRLRSKHYRATHVGFGISYTLPVLVALLASKPGTLVLVENPEAHLHPRGQRQLGRLIAKAASCGVQVIVESHSDHLLNGFRLEVAQGQISSSDVALHFFERIPEDDKVYTWIESPRMDSSGRIEPWPKGFFDEITEGLGALLQEEAKKQRGSP